MHTCAVQVAAFLFQALLVLFFVVLCLIEPFLSMHWLMRIVWLVDSVAQLVAILAGLGIAFSIGWSWHCWRQLCRHPACSSNTELPGCLLRRPHRHDLPVCGWLPLLGLLALSPLALPAYTGGRLDHRLRHDLAFQRLGRENRPPRARPHLRREIGTPTGTSPRHGLRSTERGSEAYRCGLMRRATGELASGSSSCGAPDGGSRPTRYAMIGPRLGWRTRH